MPMSERGGGTGPGGDDWPQWPPPRPLEPPAPETRVFEAQGARWCARLAGGGIGGTGRYNLALIESVHFMLESEPERPLREVLLAWGTFAGLHDAELVALLARARPAAGAGEGGRGDRR
jgi:hypothetical protein